MGNAISYFDDLIEVPGALQHLHELAYHRYGGVSTANLQAIAARAQLYGIDTSMLEWWNSGNSHHILHEDLKIGNNSAWQHGVIAGAGTPDSSMTLYKIDVTDPGNPTVAINNKTKLARQYYKFARPGAVRIEAISDDSDFDPLAFINANGKYVVVVSADTGGSFTINGLKAGYYGIKYTTSAQYDQDLEDQQIDGGQPLTTAIPTSGVLTIYQKCGTIAGPSPDLNSDGRTNLEDVALLAHYWDCTCWQPYWCDCRDFNKNGIVGLSDLVYLASAWLQ